MFRRLSAARSFSLLAILVIAFSAISLHAQDTAKRGRKYHVPPPQSRIDVSVLRDSSGKPIENASVIFHPIENGKDAGNMELKTNEDGQTYIDVIETGSDVLVQVIAKGFQTYGQQYKVDQAQMALEIRMKRPGEQYSIYKLHPVDNPQNQPRQDAPKPQQ